jgi:limonene-1,2-epoxide hydrolase
MRGGSRFLMENRMSDLQQRRIQIVRDHMRLEIEHDWDGVLATFAHPRYDINDGGAVFDGEERVRAYFASSRTPFPDQGNEIIAIAADGDHVLVEFWLTGTHLGPLRRGNTMIAPTGRKFRVRIMASFEFSPGSAKIVCERPCIDSGLIARALELE